MHFEGEAPEAFYVEHVGFVYVFGDALVGEDGWFGLFGCVLGRCDDGDAHEILNAGAAACVASRVLGFEFGLVGEGVDGDVAVGCCWGKFEEYG